MSEQQHSPEILALAARKGATQHPGGWTAANEWRAVRASIGGWDAGRPMGLFWYPTLEAALAALPDLPAPSPPR